MTYFPSVIDERSAWTMAIGLFGVRPGPSLEVRRIEMWLSFNGVWQDMSAKRSEWASAGVPSTLAMHRLMEAGLCGGATESARIQPREGFSGSIATFEGTS